MTVFMEPATIDIPIEIVDTTDCTADLPWCQEEDVADEGTLHCGEYASLPVSRCVAGKWEQEYVTLHVRRDDAEDQPQAVALLDMGMSGFTARQARISAAHLLNAADELDPPAVGTVVTTAVKVRIGDELLTDDGWQEVIGLLFDAPIEHALLYTPARTMDDSDGWSFSFNDPVKVRRPLTGSCAIQFVEPIR